MNTEINVKSCHKSAKSFPLSLFQDSNLESGFLGGFCIDNGSFISILNWVLHTLNRPQYLERVAPVILVDGVTVANLKDCEHKQIENKTIIKLRYDKKKHMS